MVEGVLRDLLSVKLKVMKLTSIASVVALPELMHHARPAHIGGER